jgi:hypothetical protein
VPDNSVFELGNLRGDKKFELYNQGIIHIKEIPDEYPLSVNQRIQVECERSGNKIIDRTKVNEFLNSLTYPLYFFDLETFNPAVPLFDNSCPYQQIPFQFSIHYKKIEEINARALRISGRSRSRPASGIYQTIPQIYCGIRRYSRVQSGIRGRTSS